MCKCMSERLEALKQNSHKIDGVKNWSDIDAEFKHYNDELVGLAILVVVSGLNSKGKKVKKTLYYSVQYCPFCGEKLGDEVK